MPEEYLRGTRFVLGLLGDELYRDEATHIRGMPPFKDLDDALAIELVLRLGRLALGDRVAQHLGLNAGLALCSPWPETFLRFVGRARDGLAKAGEHDPNIDLPAFIHWAENLGPPSRAKALRRALRTHARTPRDWTAVIALMDAS